jgi:hypothetical protein
MRRPFAALGIMLSASLMLITAAGANVVTFSGIPFDDPFNPVWVEDGITVTANASDFGSFTIPDTLHLDGQSPYTDRVEFTMASVFDARSIDIIPVPISGAYSARCDQTGAVCGLPFLNVLLEGYVADDLVAIMSMWMGTSPFTLYFPETFSGLTSLRLSMLADNACWDSPCTHMNIDSVTLEAVPIPAAAVLLGTAIAGLSFASRRRPRKVVPGESAPN